MTSAPSRILTVPERAASFQPLNDYVLVKVIRTPERKIRGIHLPEGCEADKWVWHGIVVALGPGDKLIHYWCTYYKCSSRDAMPAFEAHRLADAAIPRCPNCGQSMIQSGYFEKRAPIDLHIGDHILFSYDKRFAVMIEGVEFYCIHEEQHCLAVLTDPIDYEEFGMFSKN